MEEWIVTQSQASFAIVLCSSVLMITRPVNNAMWKWLNSDICRAMILLIIVLVIRPCNIGNNIVSVVILLTYSILASSLPEEGFISLEKQTNNSQQDTSISHKPLSDPVVAAGSSTSCRKRSIIDEELNRATEHENNTNVKSPATHYAVPQEPFPLFSEDFSGGADFNSSFDTQPHSEEMLFS
jgi:hypothetical protein